MKEILKKVYYCDFCKKKGLQGWRIEKHEKHCTKNKDRECRMCELVGNNKNEIVSLIKKYQQPYPAPQGDGGYITDGKELMDDTQQCPMCSLTIIRLSNCGMFPHQVKDFDYKKEIDSLFSDINEEALKDGSFY